MILYQPAVRPTSAELAPLTPVGLPSELADLTPELLADLYDAVMKFGSEDPKGKAKVLAEAEPSPVCVNASTDALRRSFVVSRSGNFNGADCYKFVLMGGGFVLWEHGVTVEGVQQFIAAVDAVAIKQGWLKEDGSRCALNRTDPVSYCVDIVFSSPGSIMQVTLKGKPSFKELLAEGERVRLLFDRPDELEVMDTSPSVALIRKSEKPLHLHRRAVVLDILREEGVDISEFGTLSPTRMASIFCKVDAALKRPN